VATTEPPGPNVTIVPLAERPQAIPTLERWFVSEWAPWYGPSGPGDAARDLAECLNRDELPLAWVAVDEEGGVIGTAALRMDSAGSETGLGPWLAALLVDQGYRGRGVGTALIAAVEDGAARLGYPALYVSTDVAMGLVERRGWWAVGTTETLRGEATIYVKTLA